MIAASTRRHAATSTVTRTVNGLIGFKGVSLIAIEPAPARPALVGLLRRLRFREGSALRHQRFTVPNFGRQTAEELSPPGLRPPPQGMHAW